MNIQIFMRLMTTAFIFVLSLTTFANSQGHWQLHCGKLILGENDGYAKFEDWGVPGKAQIMVVFRSADNDEEPLATQVAKLFRKDHSGKVDPEKLKNGVLVKVTIADELIEAVQMSLEKTVSRKHVHLVDSVQVISPEDCKRSSD